MKKKRLFLMRPFRFQWLTNDEYGYMSYTLSALIIKTQYIPFVFILYFTHPEKSIKLWFWKHWLWRHKPIHLLLACFYMYIFRGIFFLLIHNVERCAIFKDPFSLGAHCVSICFVSKLIEHILRFCLLLLSLAIQIFTKMKNLFVEIGSYVISLFIQ